VPDLSAQQWAFFAILLGACALLVSEKLRSDVVAVLIVLALAATGLLSPRQALSGFASEPAVVVVAVLVLGTALRQTGLAERFGQWVARLAGGGYIRALGALMTAVATLSAFTHHVTMTAVMLPVALDLAKKRDIPPSKLLMPLSVAASLGTTITLIGAPAFLVASAVIQQAGRPGLGIFSIAPLGLAISAAGTLFMIAVGRWLLPARRGSDDAQSRFQLDDYLTELAILPDSPFAGNTIAELQAARGDRMTVVGWIREGQHRRPPFGDGRLRPGDVLLVRAAPDQLVAIREEKGVELHPVRQYE
jgi:di/tricarboxylate transporter